MELRAWLSKGYDAVVPDSVQELGDAIHEKVTDSISEFTVATTGVDGVAAARLVAQLNPEEMTSAIFGRSIWQDSLLEIGPGRRGGFSLSPAEALERTSPMAYWAMKTVSAVRGVDIAGQMFDSVRHAIKPVARSLRLEPETPSELVNPETMGVDEINSLLAETATGGKIKNLSVSLENGVAILSGDYSTFLGPVGFRAEIALAVKDGVVSGGIRSVSAVGLDLKGILEDQILAQFRKRGIEVPDSADLADLSWLKIPGIQNLEIHSDRILFNRIA